MDKLLHEVNPRDKRSATKVALALNVQPGQVSWLSKDGKYVENWKGPGLYVRIRPLLDVFAGDLLGGPGDEK